LRYISEYVYVIAYVDDEAIHSSACSIHLCKKRKKEMNEEFTKRYPRSKVRVEIADKQPFMDW